jgi:hypothetical protein
VSAPDGMTDLERLIELQAIYHLKGRRDHAVDRKDWATYAELHTDDYVAMSISSFYHETYVRGHDGQWRFSYRKLERTHAETSPGASIMAADYSGENLLVGIAK